MILKDLPVEIQELVLKRRREQAGEHANQSLESPLSLTHTGFLWRDTPEGYDFWLSISEGDFKPFYEKYTPVEPIANLDTIPTPLGSEAPATKHKGLRFNTGKPRYDLQHPKATEGLVRVLTKGAEKYEPKNWEKGMSWSSVLASMKRHIAAIERGEDFDPETGERHIDHVQCNAHFLSAYYDIYPQGDDRNHSYLNNAKIGLDVDEVLCNWVGAWAAKEGLPTPASWHFDRQLSEKFEKMRDEGTLDDFYLGLKPLIDPADLAFEPDCYITSRPVDTAVTEQWLAAHGFPARPVITVPYGTSKVTAAKERGLDIFVDDNFNTFVEMKNAGIFCYLMDAGHNRRYDVGHHRLKSLKDLGR